MRLVFDTNVLFAAQVTKGVCALLYHEALLIEPPFTSEAILEELEEKLIVKLRMKPEEAAGVRAEIASECCVVATRPLSQPVCRDPDDDRVLATALAAEAELLVTGDKDLLVLGAFAGFSIVTPADCLARLRI